MQPLLTEDEVSALKRDSSDLLFYYGLKRDSSDLLFYYGLKRDASDLLFYYGLKRDASGLLFYCGVLLLYCFLLDQHCGKGKKRILEKDLKRVQGKV